MDIMDTRELVHGTEADQRIFCYIPPPPALFTRYIIYSEIGHVIMNMCNVHRKSLLSRTQLDLT